MRTAYFNSIKVRLEQKTGITVQLERQFQFHKGTIRTLHRLGADFLGLISIP